ncbi:Uncharacterized protein ChrSV_1270 [Chromobacterium vaccinii]|nr:Uncharacterized protein ChrSW_1270 [Chromobacterium vaccinii]QND88728.1 Uncharacterized protein ChrSV_1270 [Chromobacterium vaccinii]
MRPRLALRRHGQLNPERRKCALSACSKSLPAESGSLANRLSAALPDGQGLPFVVRLACRQRPAVRNKALNRSHA